MQINQLGTVAHKIDTLNLTQHAARVVETKYERDTATGELRVVADLKTLTYESASFAWIPDLAKPLPNPGDILLAPAFGGRNTHPNGLEHSARIDAPCPLTRPNGLINVFALLPQRWTKSKCHRDQAANLWVQMTETHRKVLFATLEKNGRMKKFAFGPSSMRHHHSWQGGNFEHSVEVAVYALELAEQEGHISRGRVDASLLILGSFLHDVGKAQEYLPNNSTCGYELTQRGQLVGHQATGQIWVAEALEEISRDLFEMDKLKIQHLICAAPSIPFELGGRQPRMMESDLIRAADRQSSQWSHRTQIAQPERHSRLGRPGA